MTLKELEKKLRLKDKDVKIQRDNLTSFRVFIYSQRQKFPITAFIDREKEFEIIKISDYTKYKNYPICVVRVKRLRIDKKRSKTTHNNENN
jgi:hypothetical protein